MSTSSSMPSSAPFVHSGKQRSLGKGIGKKGFKSAKRFRNDQRDPLLGITKPAIRRLARRGGIKRICGDTYEETRGVIKAMMENVIRDAVTYSEHARRKTITFEDVLYALKRQGITLYGFNDKKTLKLAYTKSTS